MSIDKEKPFLELLKIKDITSEILDVVFVRNYKIKREYKLETDIFFTKENGKEYYILVISLPGVNKESIDISIDEDNVIIQAKRDLFFPLEMLSLNQDEMIKFLTEKAISIENYYGNIYRKIRLPKKIKKKEQQVTYFRGFLFVKLECE